MSGLHHASHTSHSGGSVNGFINRAIDNQISQDRRKSPCKVQLRSEQEEAQETAFNDEETGAPSEPI